VGGRGEDVARGHQVVGQAEAEGLRPALGGLAQPNHVDLVSRRGERSGDVRGKGDQPAGRKALGIHE
jgi:hypothetical protein